MVLGLLAGAVLPCAPCSTPPTQPCCCCCHRNRAAPLHAWALLAVYVVCLPCRVNTLSYCADTHGLLFVAPTPSLPCIPQVLLHNSRQLQDASTLLQAGVAEGTTLSISCRLRGGGGDGGSTGAESRSCYLEMYAEKKPDKVGPGAGGRAVLPEREPTCSNEPVLPPCNSRWYASSSGGHSQLCHMCMAHAWHPPATNSTL